MEVPLLEGVLLLEGGYGCTVPEGDTERRILYRRASERVRADYRGGERAWNETPGGEGGASEDRGLPPGASAHIETRVAARRPLSVACAAQGMRFVTLRSVRDIC